MDSECKWNEAYESLRRFVAENPGIIINPSEISIPAEVKDEFYLRFDRLRLAVVEEHYSHLPVDIDTLCRNFLEIEKEVIGMLGIESLSMPVDLSSFLRTPKEGLIRIIYSRVFDLLQGKTTSDVFEQQCVEDLKTSSSDLYKLGYEWWAGLVVIKLLDPDQAFGVDLDEDYKPFLTELKEISFGRQAHHPTIRIPEFVIHSRKLDRLVAVKMALANEIEAFAVRFKPPVRPKKRTGDTSLALESRVMLLSFMSGPDEVPIIADIYDRILTSPDLMVECITAQDLQDCEAVEQVRLRIESMNPRLGLSLLVVNPEGDMPPENIPEGIHLVAAGFDQAKVQSIVVSLAS
jgi:hypothetical protein